jgi:hypothetical protein
MIRHRRGVAVTQDERESAYTLSLLGTCDGTHGLIVFCFSSFRQSFQQLSVRKRAKLP